MNPLVLLKLAYIFRFFPFSPRWLVAQGRDEEAIGVVSKLRSYPVEDERVQLEYMEIKAAVEFEKETTAEQYPGKHGIALSLAQYAMLFQSMGLFRRLSIGCIMQFFQQFTGVNAIIYYAPTVGFRLLTWGITCLTMHGLYLGFLRSWS